MNKIERKSSMECEPPTLSFEQIQYAREAALYVMNTQSLDEALRTFTEGLKPVVAGVKKGRLIMDYSDDEQYGFPDVAAGLKKVIRDSDGEHEYFPDVAAAHRTSPSLLCVSTLRDVVSAPF